MEETTALQKALLSHLLKTTQMFNCITAKNVLWRDERKVELSVNVCSVLYGGSTLAPQPHPSCDTCRECKDVGQLGPG